MNFLQKMTAAEILAEYDEAMRSEWLSHLYGSFSFAKDANEDKSTVDEIRGEILRRLGIVDRAEVENA